MSDRCAIARADRPAEYIAVLPTWSDAALALEALADPSLVVFHFHARGPDLTDAGYHACVARLVGTDRADAFRAHHETCYPTPESRDAAYREYTEAAR